MTFVYEITFVSGQKLDVSEKKTELNKALFLDRATTERMGVLVKVGEFYINPDSITTLTVKMVDR